MNHYRNVLENNGIKCLIKNESLLSTAGELPPIVAWPELWIHDESQASHAKTIIKELTEGSDERSEDWLCDNCGESNEGQFKICWNCTDGELDILRA